jgi:uncharacterized protein Yka (UPF0111/DUF47 family)
MRQLSDRKIKVNKAKLIEKIKENKAKHIEEYKQAVIDFKDEADKALTKLRKDLNKGNLNLYLSMTTPENKEAEYDKLVEQFEWELADEVELSQSEFNQYIHDEFDFAVQARLSNTMYSKTVKY